MGISSSLNAGVMGLKANAQSLSGISDNIANSQTYGYKRAETDFTALVNYGNSTTSFNAGGVRATTTHQVSQQGSLISTRNATDISVNGRGLIPVTTVAERDEASGTRPFMLTTSASFSPDDDGFLKTAGSLQLLGWPTDANGEVAAVSRESAVNLVPVSVEGFDFAPNPTTEAELSVNLPSDTPAGDDFTMTLEYFDAIGNSHNMVIEYTSVDPALRSWSMSMTDTSSNTVVGQADLVFADGTGANQAGSIDSITATTGAYDAATGIFTVPGASNPLAITVGAPGSLKNFTEFSTDFAPVSITKNGSTLGFLESVEMDNSGVLEAVYDTGQRRPIYRIPLAEVTNPDGLRPESGQAFSISNESGPVYLWNAGDGPTGTLSGYSLQESTTDITEELTQLIKTQRAYSSNAKIVQTVDEMLQETTNLKR